MTEYNYWTETREKNERGLGIKENRMLLFRDLSKGENPKRK